jgi:hypothetical protein
MPGREMPSKHLAAPAAFEANHVVPVNGSADRHRWRPLSLGLGCWFSESGERLMDGRDEGCELIGCDWFRRTYAATILVVSSRSSEAVGGASAIFGSPGQTEKIACRAEIEMAN